MFRQAMNRISEKFQRSAMISDAQDAVEDFVKAAADDSNDLATWCVLHAWTLGRVPRGVLAPAWDGEHGPVYEKRVLREASRRGLPVLVACSLMAEDEMDAAEIVLGQLLATVTDVVIIAVVAPHEHGASEDYVNSIQDKASTLLRMGASDILFDLSPSREALQMSIQLSVFEADRTVRRLQLAAAEEPGISDDELLDLQEEHRQLLWEAVPEAMQMKLPRVRHDLFETSSCVDRLLVTRGLGSRHGRAFQAVDDVTGELHVVKVVQKSRVTSPYEVETIYRELRVTSEYLRHPNVVRCLEILHSPSRLYAVFAQAGHVNLEQCLSNLPRQMMEEAEAMDGFSQLVSGLGYCHARDVAHCQISLAHVVISKAPPEHGLQWVIVDFSQAVLSRGESNRLGLCGRQPFMAPEVALGNLYVPYRVDLWCMGILLLETAGGLGSLSSCLGLDVQSVLPSELAHMEREYFSPLHDKSHPGVNDAVGPAVGNIVGVLLRMEPGDRYTMSQLMTVQYDNGTIS